MIESKSAVDVRGQGLLEVIIAMTIFVMIVAALATMAINGSDALAQTGKRLSALSLLQEGEEAARSIRDQAWNNLFYYKSGVTTTNNSWIFRGEGTEDSLGEFNRVITLSDVCRDNAHNILNCPGSYVDLHAKKVRVEVGWPAKLGMTNSIQHTGYLTNWDSRDWTQNNWQGGPGQQEWLNNNMYESDDGNIDHSSSGTIKLKKRLNHSFSWGFNTTSSYDFDPNKIEFNNGYVQLKKDASDKYYTDDPAVSPKDSYSEPNVYVWSNFNEQAVKNGGEIYYQLSDDDGTAWFYWHNGQWTAASGTGQYNTAKEIDQYILRFNTSTKKLMFKAFLHSDGFQDVKLDSVEIGYAESGELIYSNSGVLQSSAFKANTSSKFQIIEWTSASSACALCAIKLQVRTATSSVGYPSSWTEWYGANGQGDYFLANSLLPTALNNKQWAQYRVELSGNGNGTPILDEIKINFK